MGEIDASVAIAVQDDGPGVKAADRDAIFAPGHRQTTNGSGSDHGGAGLGLALARRLARGVGGDVTLATSNGGARFVITLPRA